jgi:hypothetical protein
MRNAQALCPRCHDEKDNVAKSKSKYWAERGPRQNIDKSEPEI